jgi:hypothetical protein
VSSFGQTNVLLCLRKGAILVKDQGGLPSAQVPAGDTARNLHRFETNDPRMCLATPCRHHR